MEEENKELNKSGDKNIISNYGAFKLEKRRNGTEELIKGVNKWKSKEYAISMFYCSKDELRGRIKVLSEIRL